MLEFDFIFNFASLFLCEQYADKTEYSNAFNGGCTPYYIET